MSYEKIREVVKTGDPIGVSGNGFFGKVIKFITSEKFTHVALFVWQENSLWVYEFVEGKGYQCTPASQWFELRSGQEIWVGKAPTTVRENPDLVWQAVNSFRKQRHKQHYGIISLLIVAIAQLTRKNLPTYFKVCSTFVQFVWESCGHEFTMTADPGNILRIASEEDALVLVSE